MKVPLTAVETVRVELPDDPARTTLLRLSETESPIETAFDRETVPVKPFRLATVIIEVLEDPARMVSDDGTADILKSTTVAVTVTI